MNDIVTSIAAAVEEQSLTTREISENVSEASGVIQNVNENVVRSTTYAVEITSDICDVSETSEGIFQSTSSLKESSDELAELADELKTLIEKFKVWGLNIFFLFQFEYPSWKVVGGRCFIKSLTQI